MLGVRFEGGASPTRRRAIDQSFVMRAETPLRTEPRFWDCNLASVPEDAETVEVSVQTSSTEVTRSFAVRSLEDDGLTACPRLRD